MVAAANLVEVAALVGDTARATILAALMGGQALTGSELAYLARVSRPTASEHLVKLTQARLVSVTRQGRYRYYRIASPLVARMIESIIAVAAIEVPSRYQPRSIQDDALRFARTCYDHLAGQIGVAITDALVANGHIVLGEDGGEVTAAGARFLTGIRRRFALARPADLLPALPRLERAPLSRRRSGGRGDLAPLPGARLAHAPARHPRAAIDRGRQSGAARQLRRGPRARWPRAFEAGRRRARGPVAPAARIARIAVAFFLACFIR